MHALRSYLLGGSVLMMTTQTAGVVLRRYIATCWERARDDNTDGECEKLSYSLGGREAYRTQVSLRRECAHDDNTDGECNLNRKADSY